MDPRLEPTACEYQLAYELIRPAPWLKSPVQHAAEIVVGYREGLIVRLLEPLAARLPDAHAKELRAVIKVIRGELKPSDMERQT
jgi:hypothetical protein